jgi:hypothetical protein
VFCAHGEDSATPLFAGEMGVEALRILGSEVEWHTYPAVMISTNAQTNPQTATEQNLLIADIAAFVQRVIIIISIIIMIIIIMIMITRGAQCDLQMTGHCRRWYACVVS